MHLSSHRARYTIRDPALKRAVDRLIEPYTGKKLRAANDAIKRVIDEHKGGTTASILARYALAIGEAVAKVKEDRKAKDDTSTDSAPERVE